MPLLYRSVPHASRALGSSRSGATDADVDVRAVASGRRGASARGQTTVMLEPPGVGRPEAPVCPRGAHDRIGDRKPEAGPALLVRGAMEPVEHAIPLVRWDPRAGVIDRQPNPASVPTNRQTDSPAFGRVLARVVEEHADQAIEPLGRSAHHVRTGFHVNREGLCPQLGDGPKPIPDLLGEHARSTGSDWAGPGASRTARARACPPGGVASATSRRPAA